MLEALLRREEDIATEAFPDQLQYLRQDRKLLNEPFHFEGTSGHAVLLVHGWTSTAFELRQLGQRLNDVGCTVYAPILRGHGTTPKDLESVKWTDWYEDVEKAYEYLKRNHDSVFVGGSSIGGNLALLLSQRRPDVAGLILISTPLYLRNERLGRSILKTVSLFMKYKKKYYPTNRAGVNASTRVTSYPTYPISNAFEAYDLIRESRRNVSRVVQPCFMAQSYHDHLVVRESLDQLYRSISSDSKKKLYVYGAYHTFVADPDKKFVHDEIAEFVAAHMKKLS